MKKICLTMSLALALVVAAHLPVAVATDLTLTNAPTKVCFTPGGECADMIVEEINNAKSEVLLQAYSFTSKPIAQALVNAHKRGVKVEAILDKSQRSEKYTSATFLANMKVPTYIDASHAIAHNKVIVIDKEVVITGSFNFTKAAQRNTSDTVAKLDSIEEYFTI